LEESSESSIELPDFFCLEDYLAEELQCLEVQAHSTISYHALSGGTSHATPRFHGHVSGSPVQVLVDGGSTDNFVQARVAKFLNLSIEPAPPFSVVVGSGQRLRCDGVVRQVHLSIQGCNLVVDLYVLSLHGADIVLGVSWLSSLGPILQDYSQRLFEFSLKGQKYSWIGEPSDKAQPVQLHTL